jgi:hypothetical protein
MPKVEEHESQPPIKYHLFRARSLADCTSTAYRIVIMCSVIMLQYDPTHAHAQTELLRLRLRVWNCGSTAVSIDVNP